MTTQPLSPSFSHERFSQQARWGESLRRYLFKRYGLGDGARVLEVGCGTGAVIASLHGYANYQTHGLDIHLPFVRFARSNDPSTRYTCGDALRLPYADAVMDGTYCHFLLLWVANPAAALAEMLRVTRPGGVMMALAEPDYGGRVDYPPPLDQIGRLQRESLRQQGAEPDMGRGLAGLFHAAGLSEIETGVLGAQWQGKPSPQDRADEWDVLESDLSGHLSPAELERMRRVNETAWEDGSRVLFVPTFYAVGRKK